MRNIVKFFLLCVLATIFTSCSAMKKEVEKDYDVITKKEEMSIDKLKLDKKLNIKKKRRQCVDLSINKRLTSALSELSFIEKREYKLKDSSKDIQLPTLSNQICIGDIDSLAKIIYTLTIYELKQESHEWTTNLPKVITVDYKENTFQKKVPISIRNNNKDIADTLTEIGKDIGYTIMYKQSDDMKVGQQGSDNINNNNINGDSLQFFKGKYISFSGDKVENLLNYISESLNIYYDIYPDKKMIIFKKYKTKQLKLTMQDTVIETTMQANPVSNGEGASSEQGGVSNKVEIKLYDSAKTSIEKILGINNGGSNEKDFVYILQNGTVVVKTTKDKMLQAEKIIHDYNSSFSKDIELTIDIYNVLIRNNRNLGIDVNWINDTINLATSNLASNIGTLTKITGSPSSSSGTTTKRLIVDSLNEYGKFLNITSLYLPLKNHIPKSRAKLKTQEYFKKTTFTQTGATDVDGNPIYKSDPTIDESKTGVEGIARASINGYEINIDLSFAISNLIELVTVKQGEDTVTVAENEEDTFDYKNTFIDGEIRVADAYYFKELAKNYEGMFPLEDFIVGGESGNSYVNKALVFVVTAKSSRR